MTQWKGQAYLFAAASNNTPENRQEYGMIIAENSSGETIENEGKTFNQVSRFSTSGDLPAQMFGINTLIKVAMWGPIETFFNETLSNTRIFVIANDDLTYQGDPYAPGELVYTTSEYATIGEQFTWQDSIDAINAERIANSQAPLLLIEVEL